MAFKTYLDSDIRHAYDFADDPRANELLILARHPSFGYTPLENSDLMPTSDELSDLFDIFDIA